MAQVQDKQVTAPTPAPTMIDRVCTESWLNTITCLPPTEKCTLAQLTEKLKIISDLEDRLIQLGSIASKRKFHILKQKA